MASDELLIATRYARALFQLAEEETKLDAVKDDVQLLKTVLDQSSELRKFLVNPLVTRDEAEKAMSSVLNAVKATELTRKFLILLAQQRRLPVLPQALDSYLHMLAQSRGEITVQVTSAKTLGEAQLGVLNAALTKATGKEVHIKTRENPDIIGGVQVRVGSKMLDYSIAGKLDRLRQTLTNGAA